MIAQSAIGNPRIMTPATPTIQERYSLICRHLHLSIACEFYFKDTIEHYYDHNKLIQPTLAQLNDLAQAYIDGTYTSDTEPHAVVEFRKYLFNYVSGIDNSKELKKAIAKTRDYL
jgi:tRNA-dihydrouridine synthase